MVVFFVLGACATPQPVSQGTPQTPPSTFEYSQFFNRVKEQVRAHWAPPEDLRLGDPTGRIEVAEDRYTLLQVTLRADGSLANIWVVHTCGLDWLDETAIAAFEEAQPFLDPPAEVIEAEHGTITFGFGFFFEASGSPRLKLFRYKSATPQPVSQGTLQASPSAALPLARGSASGESASGAEHKDFSVCDSLMSASAAKYRDFFNRAAEYRDFFNRLKDQVHDRWEPAEEYRRRDPTGKMYGDQDRYTLLQVSLKADGSLANLSVVHTCGLDFLDDTAITAFEEAQPFSDPPRRLIEAGHGTMTFRFGFCFKVSDKFKVPDLPRLKLFPDKGM